MSNPKDMEADRKLQALRRRFPHTRTQIYLNHAATGPLSRPVVQAVRRYLQQRYLGPIDNYEELAPIIDETRRLVATVLGTTPDRIAFAPNTSSALGLLAQGLDWRPGDRIAIPACEFPANVYPFMNLQHRGVQIDWIPHREGTFTVEDVARALTPRTRLVTLSWVQFLSGFRADLAQIVACCHERGVWVSVDAIQGLGALPIDVEATGIDLLAAGTHKWLMGLQGLAVCYVRPELQEVLRPRSEEHTSATSGPNCRRCFVRPAGCTVRWTGIDSATIASNFIRTPGVTRRARPTRRPSWRCMLR